MLELFRHRYSNKYYYYFYYRYCVICDDNWIINVKKFYWKSKRQVWSCIKQKKNSIKQNSKRHFNTTGCNRDLVIVICITKWRSLSRKLQWKSEGDRRIKWKGDAFPNGYPGVWAGQILFEDWRNIYSGLVSLQNCIYLLVAIRVTDNYCN